MSSVFLPNQPSPARWASHAREPDHCPHRGGHRCAPRFRARASDATRAHVRAGIRGSRHRGHTAQTPRRVPVLRTTRPDDGVRGAGMGPPAVLPQGRTVSGEISHGAMVFRRDPPVEGFACLCSPSAAIPTASAQAVGLRDEAIAQRQRADQGWRPSQRAKAITSAAGGTVFSSP